ncbi:unnamed protein product [Mytilus edulis]|uniref:Uncharacterized protein n=1 Tax=Mytilus edulis TaxID=6550 RepID=A0A8S3UBN0_MYTED|nr:unnamed protein product [Mytilus edulis]
MFLGCWKGTWGRNCSELCPANCINQNCYPETGLCVWGCDAQNCLNNQCDNKTGVCTDGCEIGQTGQYCNKQCDNGFYGFNCKTQCATCFNMSCERFEGNCSYGCIDGRYEGVRCQTLVNGEMTTKENNSSASIGGGIGAVVVIVVVVTILIIIYRRRSKPRKEKNIRDQNEISRGEENTYCNHNIALTTDDVCLNFDSVQDTSKEKPPFAGKTESKTSVIEVIDGYPEEYDEEEEGNSSTRKEKKKVSRMNTSSYLRDLFMLILKVQKKKTKLKIAFLQHGHVRIVSSLFLYL